MIRYKLGDIVHVISEREDNPSNCKYDKFVGLEHYVSGEVEIKNYGNTDLLKSAMKVFRAGDILIARRNVYLKRASVVKFDGITSGDSIVLRAKDELIKKLLPFVLNTDNFWEYAEKFSDGTMSKRLSPKILLEYEFNLPDIKEQEKLAELLWAANDTKEAYKKLLAITDDLIKSQFIEMFGNPISNTKMLPTMKLNDLASLITKGASPTWQGFSYTADETQTLFITSENVREGWIDLSERKYLEDGFNEKQKRSMLKRGDFLINIVGASIGRAVRYELDCKANINQAVALVRLNSPKVISDYILYYLNSPKALQMYNAMKSSVARANLSLQDIGNLEILIPDVEEQNTFGMFLQQTDKSKFELQQTILNLESTIKSLMLQYIG